MADYDVLLPEVLPEAPGCSEPLAVREIRSATIELCTKGLMVKQTLTAQNVVIDDPYVAIPIPANRKLIHLQNMQIDGRDVDHRSSDALDIAWRDENAGRAIFADYHQSGYDPNPDGWRSHRCDLPSAYYLEVDDTSTRIRLVGIPRKSYTTLTYKMVLAPSRASTGFDTWVLDDYFKTIAAGALAGLLSIPKKPWTDLATAAMYRSRFNEGVADALGDGARDFTRDDESTGRTTAYV